MSLKLIYGWDAYRETSSPTIQSAILFPILSFQNGCNLAHKLNLTIIWLSEAESNCAKQLDLEWKFTTIGRLLN